MEQTVLLLLVEPFAEWEAAYVAAGLAQLGGGRFAVRTVALTKDPVLSIGGLNLLPDFGVFSAPRDFEALILIGGASWRTPEARRAEPLVRLALDRGKVLGGICDAAGFLAALGVLNQVRHTGNDLEDMVQWAGPAYTGRALFQRRQAVRDRLVVTANGTAALEFAREVMLALSAAPEAQIQSWYAFHKRGCYPDEREAQSP